MFYVRQGLKHSILPVACAYHLEVQEISILLSNGRFFSFTNICLPPHKSEYTQMTPTFEHCWNIYRTPPALFVGTQCILRLLRHFFNWWIKEVGEILLAGRQQQGGSIRHIAEESVKRPVNGADVNDHNCQYVDVAIANHLSWEAINNLGSDQPSILIKGHLGKDVDRDLWFARKNSANADFFVFS